MTKSNKEKDIMWSSDLNITEPCIWLKDKVSDILFTLQDKAEDNECSILFKGYWDINGFVVDNEYYIPKQEVGRASVDYLENIGALRVKDGYNVVVHSHPFSKGSGSFSSADEKYINSHFDCSLLMDGGGRIVDARLCISTPEECYKMLVEVDEDNIKEYTTRSINLVGIENICVKQYQRYNKSHEQLILTQENSLIKTDNKEKGIWEKDMKTGTLTFIPDNKKEDKIKTKEEIERETEEEEEEREWALAQKTGDWSFFSNYRY